MESRGLASGNTGALPSAEISRAYPVSFMMHWRKGCRGGVCPLCLRGLCDILGASFVREGTGQEVLLATRTF
jgi:hypothetical protein